MKMNRYWMLVWFIIGITVGLLIPKGHAHAQTNKMCGERTAIIKAILKSYEEVPKHIALASNGSVLETVVSSTGTWTILLTNPNGRACVMAVGTAWEDLDWNPPRKGTGT